MRLLTIKVNNSKKQIKINVPEEMAFIIGKGGNSIIVENNEISLGHFLNHSNTDLTRVFKFTALTELKTLKALILTTTDSKRSTQVLNLIDVILS